MHSDTHWLMNSSHSLNQKLFFLLLFLFTQQYVIIPHEFESRFIYDVNYSHRKKGEMSKQPLEFDDSKSRLAALVGGIIAFVALFFPLFTVTYNPPGGSAIVAGHRIYAFVDPISGWEFANSAAYFKLLPAIVILFSLAGLGSILLWLPFNVVKQTLHQVQSYLSAFVHIVISLGWLLVLFLAIVIGTPAIPVTGEAGILPAFQIPPYAPAADWPKTVEVPHFSATIGIGFFLLLIGLAIGGVALFKKIAIIVIALIIILPISYWVDKAIFQFLIVRVLGI